MNAKERRKAKRAAERASSHTRSEVKAQGKSESKSKSKVQSKITGKVKSARKTKGAEGERKSSKRDKPFNCFRAFVGQISYKCTEDALRDHFRRNGAGEVIVRMRTRKSDGQFLGTAFVGKPWLLEFRLVPRPPLRPPLPPPPPSTPSSFVASSLVLLVWSEGLSSLSVPF